ncbi:SGNH/GDSL hydrolase family protein [[Flexibacter] sp. ATCC 35208]|uniref:SGNH/GDSL hydrolase family protein n=1 Tax=[Flexibacter] sp. ATCC 35208 TaxID=1936242 RepID=UPI0009D06559|nr:SGNH/GDSL hydrolase family protein [[Flexibacter] sp. ATCC 35208]OMP75079.1 electron transporter RnfD [[Flexibacter] sp. ATCC 35208]
MKKHFCLFLICIMPIQLQAQEKFSTIKSNDPHIHYMGRVIQTDNSAQLSWSATTASINFKGTGVKVKLKDERGDNYYNVVVDGKVISKLQPDSTVHTYTLVSGLKNGNHTLVLFKRTEWAMGKTWLYNFEVDGTLLQAPVAKKRKIEFYGNSITCGYAVEDSSGKDRGTGPYENAYISYASLTARHFNAEYHLVAKSGIGVLISWFPLIMPEMYDRTDATDAASKWDFSSYTPDLIVINLFQNDSWLVAKPEHEQFKAKFGDKVPDAKTIVAAYSNLVKKIRDKHPKAQIICALGNMDATRKGSPWPGYIKEAVLGLHDAKIHTCFFPYKDTPGHPNAKEQEAMANELIAYISKNIKW